MSNWGYVIKSLREKLGLTQGELADKSDIDRSWLSRVEIGHYQTVKDGSLAKLAAGLGMTITELRKKIYNIPDEPESESKATSLRVAKEDIIAKIDALEEVIEIPIVGYIAAGTPVPTEQIELGTFPIPKSELSGVSSMERLFGLKVSGNSLIGDGIEDGDTAIIDPVLDIIDGKIYVVETEEGHVARHLHRENGTIVLIATNGSYTKLTPKELVIKGRLIISGKLKRH